MTSSSMSLLKQWLLPSALHRLEQAVLHCIYGSQPLITAFLGPQACSSLQTQQVHTHSNHAPAAPSVEQQPTASSSNLRSDLGSGTALGTMQGFDQGSSDTALRRQSLLSNGKRFYDTVQVQPCPLPADQPRSALSSNARQGYQLLLRKHTIKTPAKNVLVLPTLSLALAVAAEWECLPTGKPAPHRMPLTGLACTAIDQPKEPAKVIEHLLKYVHTDGACIR